MADNCAKEAISTMLEAVNGAYLGLKDKYPKEYELISSEIELQAKNMETILSKYNAIEDLAGDDLAAFDVASEVIYDLVEKELKPTVYKQLTTDVALKEFKEGLKGLSVGKISKSVKRLVNMYAGDSVISRDSQLQGEFNKVVVDNLSDVNATKQMLDKFSMDKDIKAKAVAALEEGGDKSFLADLDLSKEELDLFDEYVSAVKKAQSYVFDVKESIGIIGAGRAKDYTLKFGFDADKVKATDKPKFKSDIKNNLDWEGTVKKINESHITRAEFNKRRAALRREAKGLKPKESKPSFEKIEWDKMSNDEKSAFQDLYAEVLYDDITGKVRNEPGKKLGSIELIRSSAAYKKGGKGNLSLDYSIHDNLSEAVHKDLANSAKDTALFSVFGGKISVIEGQLAKDLASEADLNVKGIAGMGGGPQKPSTAEAEIQKQFNNLIDSYINPVSKSASVLNVTASILKNSTIGLLGGVMRSAFIGDVSNKALVTKAVGIVEDPTFLGMLNDMAKSTKEGFKIMTSKQRSDAYRALQNSSNFLLLQNSVSRFDPITDVEFTQTSNPVVNVLLGMNRGLKTMNGHFLKTTGVNRWTEAMSGAVYAEQSMLLKSLDDVGVDKFVENKMTNLSAKEKAAAKSILKNKEVMDKITADGHGFQYLDLANLKTGNLGLNMSKRTQANVATALGGTLDGISKGSITQVNAIDAREMNDVMGTLLGTFRTTIFKQTMGNIDLYIRDMERTTGQKFGVLAHYTASSMLFGLAADYVFSAAFNRESAIDKIKSGRVKEGLLDSYDVTSAIPFGTDYFTYAAREKKFFSQNAVYDLAGPAFQKGAKLFEGPEATFDALMQSATDYAGSHWAAQMIFSGADLFGGKAYRLKPSIKKGEILQEKKSKYWED